MEMHHGQQQKNAISFNNNNNMPRPIDDNSAISDTVAENDDDGYVTTRGLLIAPPPSPVSRSLLLACSGKPLVREAGSETSSSAEVRSDASRFLRATLADALSSSLATIAGRGVAAAARGGGEGSSCSSSSDARQQSSSTSSGMHRQIRISNGPAIVTASGINTTTTTTTSSGLNTSSGDDRNSSGGNSGSAAMPSEGPFLRQHHQRRRSARDGYGLPIHMEDEDGAAGGDYSSGSHAMVQARLPPPQTDFSSSGRSSLASAHSSSRVLRNSDDRKRAAVPTIAAKKPSTRIKRQRSTASCSSNDAESQSSGTEGGYAGSASSNDAQQSSSSSSSSSSDSSGDYQGTPNHHHHRLDLHHAPTNDDLQSRVASKAGFAFQMASRSCSPVSSTFSNSSSSDELEDDVVVVPPKRRRKRSRRGADDRAAVPSELASSLLAFTSKMERATGRTLQGHECKDDDRKPAAIYKKAAVKSNHKRAPIGLIDGKPAIFSLGGDTMAHCLSYLEPPEAHELLTMPLSKDWYDTFTQPHHLWRVLCLSEPFKATFDDDSGGNGENDDDSGEEESLCPFPVHSNVQVKHLFGRYRLLYTSFIRCMRYLERIKDDALHGRPPSVIDNGGAGVSHHPFTSNSKLKHFLARARNIVDGNKKKRAYSPPSSGMSSPCPPEEEPPFLGVSDSDTSSARKRQKVASATKQKSKPNPNVKYGHSVITQRLLGPAKTGEVGDVNLPWSCAIYSIVNWMVAFSDVEGIQTLCLRVLPNLLEDEDQRTTAQRAGLTSIVLRGMVTFPDSFELHTAAFHTIVLLARPLGGREGMLFHSSMVNSSGVFSNGSHSGKNGIAVMLDSMRRFASEEALQAMSCWSLVNIALASSQKTVLAKLGGISAVANAMMQHPYSAEVQFRALFALINLVIPTVTPSEEEGSESRSTSEQLEDVNDVTEKEILDENVGQIANLVVLAMKNFCSSQTILNRACLVLHNLSLTHEYHSTLLWTPNCYQMLEWCLANYPGDQVLQQSAAGTLHRLQVTLSGDEALRRQFTASIQAQQQLSLEQAHREATLLRDQQEQQEVADQR